MTVRELVMTYEPIKGRPPVNFQINRFDGSLICSGNREKIIRQVTNNLFDREVLHVRYRADPFRKITIEIDTGEKS